MFSLRKIFVSAIKYRHAPSIVANLTRNQKQFFASNNVTSFVSKINDKHTIKTSLRNDHLEFELNENLRKKFPYIWLRDNCKCTKCFNYLADEVELDLLNVDENIAPYSVELKAKDKSEFLEIVCKYFWY
jgi:hypothetical protein